MKYTLQNLSPVDLLIIISTAPRKTINGTPNINYLSLNQSVRRAWATGMSRKLTLYYEAGLTHRIPTQNLDGMESLKWL